MTIIEERRERVSNGSRRRRDLDAVAAADREREAELRERILSAVELTPAAQEAWDRVRRDLRHRLPRSTWELWIEPLVLAGEHESALVVTGPPRAIAWIERRYGGRLGDEVRAEGPYRGIYVFAGEEPETDRCL